MEISAGTSGLPDGKADNTGAVIQRRDCPAKEDVRAQSNGTEQQVVLVLVGLPGSAKSTFSNALVAASLTDQWGAVRASGSGSVVTPGSDTIDGTSRPSRRTRAWTRVSQDEAPSRRRQECERQVVDALGKGDNVVVDRVNFDPSQRAHFINLAKAHYPPPRIYALILNTSLSTLRDRLSQRPSHPTLPDPETALRVLSQMKASYDPPRATRSEGFDRVYSLPESRQPVGGVWGGEALSAVLDDIEREGEMETGERFVAGRGGTTRGTGTGWRGGQRGGSGPAFRGGGRGGGLSAGRGGYGGWNGGGYDQATGREGHAAQAGYGGRGVYGGYGGHGGHGGHGGYGGHHGPGGYGGSSVYGGNGGRGGYGSYGGGGGHSRGGDRWRGGTDYSGLRRDERSGPNGDRQSGQAWGYGSGGGHHGRESDSGPFGAVRASDFANGHSGRGTAYGEHRMNYGNGHVPHEPRATQ